MDESKQPGIKCDSIILVESVFNRKPQIPDDMKFNIDFAVSNSISPDIKNLVTEITATLNKPDDPIYMRIKYVGLFSVAGEGNMDIKEFSKSNAPAILFPYIREEIHGKMIKACLPKSLIIPPLNLVALIQKSNS
jgi:preprotein translocase subunit SecB